MIESELLLGLYYHSVTINPNDYRRKAEKRDIKKMAPGLRLCPCVNINLICLCFGLLDVDRFESDPGNLIFSVLIGLAVD